VTRVARKRAGSGASTIGSCQTVPVKYASGARLVVTAFAGVMVAMMILPVGKNIGPAARR
jgi:hypothetical protein